MTHTNITDTTYNTRSEARQAAWAAGYRCKCPTNTDIMRRRDDVIIMTAQAGVITFKEHHDRQV